MIRCSTLHDLQCLCHQKCCTILIFQFQFVFTHRLRQSCHKNTRHERNSIPGMLNSVPFRTAALGTAQKINARQFSVMGPNIIFASQRNRVRLGGCIKLHYGGAVFFFFFFFRDAVSSLTRAFSLHKIHIYWNKRKGQPTQRNRAGPPHINRPLSFVQFCQGLFTWKWGLQDR